MDHAATFNDEFYKALRDSDMEERHAMRAAKAVPRVAEVREAKTAVERIDKTLAHMDKRIDVLDAKMDGIQGQLRTLSSITVPMLVVTVTALIGIIGLQVRLLMVSGGQ